MNISYKKNGYFRYQLHLVEERRFVVFVTTGARLEVKVKVSSMQIIRTEN